jgi:hypothetical protein
MQLGGYARRIMFYANLSVATEVNWLKLTILMCRSAAEWAKSDAQLIADTGFQAVFDKFSVPATKDALEKTVKALQDKKHIVKVVENEKEAVEFLGSLLKDGMSVSMGGSATLAEIGFIDYLKTQDSRIINLKGQAAAAAAAGKMQEHNALLSKVCVFR